MTDPVAVAPPVVQSMEICDVIIHDQLTNKRSLIGIFHNINAHKFPCLHPQLCVYIALSDGRGEYEGLLRLKHLGNDETIAEMAGKFVCPNPLAVVELNFELRPLPLPHSGKYAFQFYVGNALLAKRDFSVSKIEESG